MDVVCQRLQRGDVQAVDAVLQAILAVAAKQFVDDATEARERLAAARRRTDERVLPVVNERNGFLLWRREEATVVGDERAELVDPPLPDGRFQQVEHLAVVYPDVGRVEGQVPPGEQIASSRHVALFPL